MINHCWKCYYCTMDLILIANFAVCITFTSLYMAHDSPQPHQSEISKFITDIPLFEHISVRRAVKLEICQRGRWHNGSAFVFCSCGCTFESEPSPTSAHACGEMTSCMPAAMRLASVAPEVNLGECTLHSPPQK